MPNSSLLNIMPVFDIVVIGSGPAGTTTARYAAEKLQASF